MPRDRKKYNETMRPITRAHRASNRQTDNEIKHALGLDSLPATLLRNAWRRGRLSFIIQLLDVALMATDNKELITWIAQARRLAANLAHVESFEEGEKWTR